MNKALADPRIQQFRQLINAGIEAWTKAGELLVQITRDNPEAYVTILSDNPHLTRDILESFERIGRREIYPYLVVDGSPGARRLAALPYDSQVKIYQGRVPVVVKTTCGFEERRKRISELTNGEAALVFDIDKLRPVKEQTNILREFDRRKRMHVVRASEYVHEEQPSNNSCSLSEKPDAELARLLNTAQEAMLEARTALALLKRDSPTDDLDLHITKALREIGSLRFKIANNEL